jgi:hypothetical protein
MKQIPQRILGNGHGGPYGDCFKCCVASILDREYEDVPNFVDPAVLPHRKPYEFCGEMWFEESEHEPWNAEIRK